MFICDEERQILVFLRQSPDSFYSAAEICRRVGSKKLMARDPRWAFRYLNSLLDKKLIERDSSGHYRFLPPREEE